MSSFVDPRTHPAPNGPRPHVVTTDATVLGDLHRLCHHARLYDVERWIQEGRPLQTSNPRQQTTALRIAIDHRNHALVVLLLCNGYDPNLDTRCPLDLALGANWSELIELLLQAGADPLRVRPRAVLDTYESSLFDRFASLGVDLTEGHAMAAALADHTSNKPLFGYAKRKREHDPRIQKELNIALIEHTRAQYERGIMLCLWAGADPHVPSIDLHDRDPVEGDDPATTYFGTTPISEACYRSSPHILTLLKPDPARDDFDELFGLADRVEIIEYLAAKAQPKDGNAIVEAQIRRSLFGLGCEYTLRCLFKLGVRWTEATDRKIAETRRNLLALRDEPFVQVMKLLVQDDHCADDILLRLARTPSMRARIAKVGIGRLSSRASAPGRSPRARLGIALPKQAPSIQRLVQIGRRRPHARELRLDRKTLFERVWTEPIEHIAKAWGLSGRGLAKACARVQVPTPPRGAWAQMQAGHRIRRPTLPRLEVGQAEVIVVYETTSLATVER